MAFTENLKLVVKRRAHFMCCLCHSLCVEVHHIIPEAKGGPDTEANAAPLCPSCHEVFGTDPTKRKLIRQARDHWYEVCQKRYTVDPDRLEHLIERLQHVVTKEDLNCAVKKMVDLLLAVLKNSGTPMTDAAQEISDLTGNLSQAVR